MNFILTLLLAGVLLVGIPAKAIAGSEDDVKAAMAELTEAFMNADAETMDRMLATPYSHINNGGGPVERSAYVAWQHTRAEREAKDGKRRYTAYETSDIKVDFLNEKTAVVTGLGKLSGERDGRPWSLDFRFTNVWTLDDDGQWQRAVFHDTYLK